MSKQIYAEVTTKILEQLEAGVAPWVRPWSTSPKLAGHRGRSYPHNVVSNRNYRGINALLLMMLSASKGYPSGAWATYKQIAARGGQVRRGEKATQIVYFGKIDVQDKRDGASPDDKRTIPLLRYFSVFNIAQADWKNGDPFRPVEGEPADGDDALPDCEATIRATGAIIKHGGDSAFYMPSADMINLPAKKAFVDKGAYYSTAFHELTHWTGHASRCDRKLSAHFGNPDYAFEELVAELGSAFLCASHGVNGTLRHAEYLGHWIKVLKEDNTAIFKASALAQKAADYIQQQSEAEVIEEAA
jgi:antirestriction protein ArdC